jgi:hypothetical protein
MYYLMGFLRLYFARVSTLMGIEEMRLPLGLSWVNDALSSVSMMTDHAFVRSFECNLKTQ